MKTEILTINGATGGIQKDFALSPFAVKTDAPQAYTFGQLNVSKPGYVGMMSAPPAFTSVDQTLNGYPIGGVRVSTGECFFLTSEARVYKLSTSDVLSLVGDIASGAGGNALAGDIWVNVDGVSGIEYVYCSYFVSSTSAWEVKRITASTGSIAGSALYSSTTNATKRHRGVVMTRYFFVTNGQYLDRFDNNSDTYTAQYFTVARGFELKSVCRYSNKYVAIVGDNGSTSRLWIWDQENLDPNFTYDIPDNNATAVVNDSGVRKIFTHGRNGTTKIFKFSGGEVEEEPMWQHDTDLIGQSPEQISTGMFYNQVFWQTPNLLTSTAVYSHGSPNKSLYYQGAHKAAGLGSYSATTGGGMCKNVKDNRLYIGFNQASGGTLAYTDLSTYDSVNIGEYISSLKELPSGSTINYIKLYVSAWQSGSNVSVDLYKNENDTTEQLQLSAPVVQYTDTAELDYYPVTKTVPNVNSFYLQLTFAKCVIRKVEISYSYEPGSL
jgi:hypothetical protein